MAEILTQRAVLLAKTETTFGTEIVPSASDDAFLVGEPDYSVDPVVIERAFARQSISALPIAVGRKIAQVTFTHEVRSNGSFDGTTEPRLGRLISACGFSGTAIPPTSATVNGETVITADTGNTGGDPISVPFAFGGTNAVIEQGNYRIRCTTGGAAATAKIRVTGGTCPDDAQTDASQEKDAVPTETFSIEPVTIQGTLGGTAPVVDDATDPESPTYTLTGMTGLTVGDVFRFTVLGLPFLVTVVTATPTGLAADAEAIIDTHPLITSTAAGEVLTIDTMTGALAAEATTADDTDEFTLNASGHTITAGTYGTMVLNDGWTLVTKPAGYEYNPISTSFPSLTIYLYLDGVLHKLTGSRGTFTVEGEGGNLATFNFTFTGNYVAVTDVALPAATFETTIPVQVELADLQVNPDIDLTKTLFDAAGTYTVSDSWEDTINGSFKDLCAASFNIDIGNEVVPRECINEADAFNGVIITGRTVTGSMDPELELVADHDFWNIFSTADVLGWQVTVGTVRGNVVRIDSDSAQYAGLTYEDRSGLRALSVDLRFSGSSPSFTDDEIRFSFN